MRAGVRTAWVLGLTGLVPFVAGAAVFGWGPPRLGGPALLALLTYAAVILSFLGGVRWGQEMGGRDPRPLTFVGAVLPSLAAWGLLAAPGLDPSRQLGGFILAFVAQWAWDVRSRSAPAWWPRLRTALTAVVCVCLAVGLEQAMDLAG